jgi:hypothetical protein
MNKKTLFVFLLLLLVLCAAAYAETRIANDPTRIGVGARLLGMGKGYVGMADDLSGIFVNPAGLANVENWQATSMSGKFLNEYDYLNLGFAYPTEYGVFGLGYVGCGIGFTSPLATTEVLDGIRIIPSTTEGVSYNFGNRVVLFSWGGELKALKQYVDWNILDDLSFGTTLKFFSLDLSGPGIVGGTASGNELDLGLHYKPGPMFQAGVALQDALPASMGGRIKWASDTEESLSATLKTGISFKVLGEEGWRSYGEHEVAYNLDYDMFPTRSGMPSLWHTGAEWSPTPYLDLRMGFDQDIVGTGTAGQFEPANNFTTGVGIYYSDFRFDYAFHQYNDIPENNTHYFSLTYGVSKVKPEVGPAFTVRPADKSILFKERVTFNGRVNSRRIRRMTVNGAKAPITNQRFASPQNLKLRKNSFLLAGYDNGTLIESLKVRILRLMKFKDVRADYWAAVPISILAMEKVISGYPDGTFKPEGNITRAEMCTLLMKTRPSAPSPKPPVPSPKPPIPSPESEAASPEAEGIFIDVPDKHWAAPYIKQAAWEEVVTGYPDGTFKPNGNISRAEGVTILARFAKLPEPKMAEVPFSDVPGRHWAVKFIASAKEAGILKYLAGKPFEPNRKLTRAEVAEMLSKADPLAKKVNDLLDWETGY